MAASTSALHRLAPDARRIARRYHFVKHRADCWLLERGMAAVALLGLAGGGTALWSNVLLARLAGQVTSNLSAVIVWHSHRLWWLIAWVFAEAAVAITVLVWLRSHAFRDLLPVPLPDGPEPSAAWRNARVVAFLTLPSFAAASAVLFLTWHQLHP